MSAAACAKIIIDGGAEVQGLVSCASGTVGLLVAIGQDATMKEAGEFETAKAAFKEKVDALIATWSGRLGGMPGPEV